MNIDKHCDILTIFDNIFEICGYYNGHKKNGSFISIIAIDSPYHEVKHWFFQLNISWMFGITTWTYNYMWNTLISRSKMIGPYDFDIMRFFYFFNTFYLQYNRYQ